MNFATVKMLKFSLLNCCFHVNMQKNDCVVELCILGKIWVARHTRHPHINLFTRRFWRNTNCCPERVSAIVRATQQPYRLHYVMASHISHRICSETSLLSMANPFVTGHKRTRGWDCRHYFFLSISLLSFIYIPLVSIFIYLSIYGLSCFSAGNKRGWAEANLGRSYTAAGEMDKQHGNVADRSLNIIPAVWHMLENNLENSDI